MDTDDYIKRERQADDEKRRKYEEGKKKDEPVIDKSDSTHKVDRFARVKQSFREQKERLKKGWKVSKEELKEDASYKVREKVGRLTADEKEEKLKRLRLDASILKTEASIARSKAQRGRGKEPLSYSIADPLEWYGLRSEKPSDLTQVMPSSFNGNILDMPGMPSGRQKKSTFDGNIMNIGGGHAVGPDLKKLKAFYGF